MDRKQREEAERIKQAQEELMKEREEEEEEEEEEESPDDRPKRDRKKKKFFDDGQDTGVGVYNNMGQMKEHKMNLGKNPFENILGKREFAAYSF